MTTVANPITYVALWLMFGVPVAILVVGTLAYYLKPSQRKTTGTVMTVTGIIELLFFLALTRNLSLVPLILYTLSGLAIVIGILSLIQSK